MADALRTLKAQHDEMASQEAQLAPSSWRGSSQGTRAEQLGRLRLQRAGRPRILFSLGVSSRTGQGLRQVRQELQALMEDQRLFPQVGAKVPLSYSMLERLAQDSRTLATCQNCDMDPIVG